MRWKYLEGVLQRPLPARDIVPIDDGPPLVRRQQAREEQGDVLHHLCRGEGVRGTPGGLPLRGGGHRSPGASPRNTISKMPGSGRQRAHVHHAAQGEPRRREARLLAHLAQGGGQHALARLDVSTDAIQTAR